MLTERLQRLSQEMTDRNDRGWRRWISVVLQSTHDLWRGNVLEWSASLAFFAVLSIFPLLLLITSGLSFLVEPDLITDRTVALLGEFLPGGEESIRQIVASAVADRRQVGVLSIVTLAFTGRRVLGAFVKGLNHVSDVDEGEDSAGRTFAVEMAMLAGLIVMALVAVASSEVVNGLRGIVSFMPGPDHIASQVAQSVVRAGFLVLFFTLIFAVVPLGRRSWKAAFAGAAISTVGFLFAQGVFRLFLGHLWSNLSLAYGPLAVGALLMTWAWCVAIIALFGGALASHVKVMIIEEASPREARQRHLDA